MYKRGILYLHLWACTATGDDGEPLVGVVLPKDAYDLEKTPEEQEDNLDVILLPIDTSKEFLRAFTKALEDVITSTWEEEEGDAPMEE